MGSRRRPGRPAAAALVAAVVALSVGMAGAVAAPVAEAGYWWRYQAVAGVPVAPAGVEEGQLYVAADAVGPSAVSAIRADLGVDSPDAVSVTLSEASSTGSPAVRACPTSGWTAPDGAGSYETRPSQERCDADGIDGVRTSEGEWRFDLPVDTFVDAGGIDVVLVPVGGAFDLVIATPGSDTVGVTTSPDSSPPAGAVTTQRPPAESPATAGDNEPARPPSPTMTTPGASALTGSLDATTSGGHGAGTGGVPAQSFDRDVDPFPTPEIAADALPAAAGDRAPLAVVAVALVALAWGFRMRAALASAPAHVLAQPFQSAGASSAPGSTSLAAAAAAISDRPEGVPS